MLWEASWIAKGFFSGQDELSSLLQLPQPLHAKNSLHNYMQLGKCMFLWKRRAAANYLSSRLAAFIKNNWWWPKMSLSRALDVSPCAISAFLVNYLFQIKGFSILNIRWSRSLIQGGQRDQGLVCVCVCGCVCLVVNICAFFSTYNIGQFQRLIVCLPFFFLLLLSFFTARMF